MSVLKPSRAFGITVVVFAGSWIFHVWLGAESSVAGAAQKKGDKSEGRKGRTIGVLTAKADNSIEVKADGEVKGRKYFPRWIGGAPTKGGGLDKATLKTFRALKIGSRIEVDWVFEERLRAVKIKVLQEPPEKQ